MEEKKSPRWLIIIAIVLYVTFTALCFSLTSNWRIGFLCIVSTLFGFVLKYGPLGFTCSFRSLTTDGDFKQYRDLLVMLFVGTGLCSLIESIQGLHPLFDPTKTKKFSDSGSPVGVSLVIGSFMFGIGMQLGSGCASGTFVGIGEGFLKAYLVLPFFVVGSVLAVMDPVYKWWSKLPATKEPVQIEFGFTLMIIMALFGLTFISDTIKSRRRQMNSERSHDDFTVMKSLFTIDGPNTKSNDENEEKWYHSIIVGAIVGVILALFYLFNGTMIGITGVLPKVGCAILKKCGVKVDNWVYFQQSPLPKNFLDVNIFDSNIFIALGAFLAATIKGNFGKGQKKGVVEYIRGVFGGLLMGFGARLANGCNIGAMTSGITSSSMHGFVWMACAIIGSLLTCQTDKFIAKKCKKESVNTFTPIL